MAEHNSPNQPDPVGTPAPTASESPEQTQPMNIGRARLVDAELTQAPGARLHARVVLERDGVVYEEEVSGVGDEVMALRLAAEATMSALDRLTGDPGRFVLVGIKTIRAFDTTVVLACVRTTTGRSRYLMGSVPAPENTARGAAMAVLHATNRLVEALERPSPTTEQT